jgi:hypothetical protein
LLDATGMLQEFEHPEGKTAIDPENLRYLIEGGPITTDGWVDVGTLAWTPNTARNARYPAASCGVSKAVNRVNRVFFWERP